MRTVETIRDLREQVAEWRGAGERIAFVPTMGNLHDGHLKLVKEAHKQADRVVVSIFVNPLQFGEGEDFDSYPRTEEVDQQLLELEQTDLLFLPQVSEMYPRGQDGHTEITVPGISKELCGAHRPGHFTGVATVCCKLFNMVQADVAIFGEKDFQQLMVIRRMVADLVLPIEIIGVATDREESGLARSSRNRYLQPQEKEAAPFLHATLQEIADLLKQGDKDFHKLERDAAHKLNAAGFNIDYVSIRHAGDLQIPVAGDKLLVVLAAAQLGGARLIDNIQVELGQ